MDNCTELPVNRAERRAKDSIERRGGEWTPEFSDNLPAGLSPALNTAEAAKYTGLAEATLEGLRSKGGGPRYIRYSRRAVRYRVPDLDDWMMDRTISSTSELAA
jgi:predicted DNA-binding transcriptional regulator AlpA